MNKDQLLSLVRYILTTFGTTAVTKGYLDGASMEAIVGGVVAITSLIWSLYHHKNSTEVRIVSAEKGTRTLLLLLAGVSLLLTGCHSITIPTQSGPATVTSFGQKTSIRELTFDNGKLRLKGYNNDQVTGMVELFNAGVEAGKKGVVP